MPVITFMSSAQVAAALAKDVRTIHRMVEDGTITPIGKMPGKTGAFLFDPTEIAALTPQESKE